MGERPGSRSSREVDCLLRHGGVDGSDKGREDKIRDGGSSANFKGPFTAISAGELYLCQRSQRADGLGAYSHLSIEKLRTHT